MTGGVNYERTAQHGVYIADVSLSLTFYFLNQQNIALGNVEPVSHPANSHFAGEFSDSESSNSVREDPRLMTAFKKVSTIS